eukprot:4223106-Amphidinium_carterae.1
MATAADVQQLQQVAQQQQVLLTTLTEQLAQVFQELEANRGNGERLQKVTQELESLRATTSGGLSARPSSGVDTRLIGKPDQFSGGANWRDWS